MIGLTAGSHGMRYVGGGWSLCAMTSVWFACQIGRYRCLYCLINWLTDVRQAGEVDGTVCNITFGAWRLGCHKFRVRVGRERMGTPFPLFFLYTPIVNCNFPWNYFGYKADSLASCCRSAKFYYGPYATDVLIKINMPSAESNFSEKELNLLK